MVKDRKVCLVVRSLGCGGSERVISELANYIAQKKECSVHIIVYSPGIPYYQIDDSVQIHSPKNELTGKKLLDACTVMWFMRNKLKSLKPDVVLSFGEIWNSFVMIAAAGLGLNVYLSDRSHPSKNLGRIHNFLRQHLYKKATGLICQTEMAKSIMGKRTGHQNMVVIGNPIRMIDEDVTVEKENIIVSVGRLISTKHFDELIQLFAEIEHSNWKLLIVGGDAKKQSNMIRLQKKIVDLDLDGRVILTGYEKNVDSILRRSRIFAFTSSSEGFPNVVGEAMSAGLPVVAFRGVPGNTDMIINGKNGFVVDLFDFEGFKQHLMKLMTDTELREQMSVNSKIEIQKFRSDIICEQYYSVLIGHNTNQYNS